METLTFRLQEAARRLWPLVRERSYLIWVFLIAVTLRVTYNLTVARAYVPIADAAEYVGLAQHLLHWGCYCELAPGTPTTYRPPGFPMFLSAVFALVGEDTLKARLALSVVGAITCLLASEMARDLFGRRTAVVAGLIAATYPQLFIYDAWLYSESLATCLFAASCLTTMRVLQRPVGWRWLAAGTLVGMTALVRPNGIYGLFAVVIWAAVVLWRRQVSPKQTVLAVGLLALGCVVILAPWTIRNFVVTDGAFVPLSSGGGIVLAGAYSDAAYEMPGFRGNWVNPANNHYMDAEGQRLAAIYYINGRSFRCWGPCEVTRDHAYTQEALSWIRTNLQLLPRLLILREQWFWRPAPSSAEAGMPILRPFADGYPTIVLLLGLPGLLALFLRRPPPGAEALIFCIFGATVIAGGLIFYGSPRMRSSLEPFLVVLAAGALVYWISRFWNFVQARRQFGPTPTTGADNNA